MELPTKHEGAHTMARRTVESLTRLNNSINGNPRYRVTFTDGSSAITASDYGFCYGIENPEIMGRPHLGIARPEVEVTFTRAGRISDISPVKGE